MRGRFTLTPPSPVEGEGVASKPLWVERKYMRRSRGLSMYSDTGVERHPPAPSAVLRASNAGGSLWINGITARPVRCAQGDTS